MGEEKRRTTKRPTNRNVDYNERHWFADEDREFAKEAKEKKAYLERRELEKEDEARARAPHVQYPNNDRLLPRWRPPGNPNISPPKLPEGAFRWHGQPADPVHVDQDPEPPSQPVPSTSASMNVPARPVDQAQPMESTKSTASGPFDWIGPSSVQTKSMLSDEERSKVAKIAEQLMNEDEEFDGDEDDEMDDDEMDEDEIDDDVELEDDSDDVEMPTTDSDPNVPGTSHRTGQRADQRLFWRHHQPEMDDPSREISLPDLPADLANLDRATLFAPKTMGNVKADPVDAKTGSRGDREKKDQQPAEKKTEKGKEEKKGKKEKKRAQSTSSHHTSSASSFDDECREEEQKKQKKKKNDKHNKKASSSSSSTSSSSSGDDERHSKDKLHRQKESAKPIQTDGPMTEHRVHNASKTDQSKPKSPVEKSRDKKKPWKPTVAARDSRLPQDASDMLKRLVQANASSVERKDTRDNGEKKEKTKNSHRRHHRSSSEDSTRRKEKKAKIDESTQKAKKKKTALWDTEISESDATETIEEEPSQSSRKKTQKGKSDTKKNKAITNTSDTGTKSSNKKDHKKKKSSHGIVKTSSEEGTDSGNEEMNLHSSSSTATTKNGKKKATGRAAIRNEEGDQLETYLDARMRLHYRHTGFYVPEAEVNKNMLWKAWKQHTKKENKLPRLNKK